MDDSRIVRLSNHHSVPILRRRCRTESELRWRASLPSDRLAPLSRSIRKGEPMIASRRHVLKAVAATAVVARAVARQYATSDAVTNLENGYWGIMAEPVRRSEIALTRGTTEARSTARS